MEVPVLNTKGEQVSTLTIDEAVLGGDLNPSLIKQAYVRYHANLRQGSARTKGRGSVDGSTRKLFKQKGTGRARVGATRSPGRKGGGHTFSKTRTREDFRKDMPVKMRRKANRNALLSKLLDGEVRVIDSLAFDAPKTKVMNDLLAALGINRTCLVAVAEDGKNAGLASRNIEHVTVCDARQLTCFEMLNCRFMVISKADLEAWIAGPSANTGKSAKGNAKEVA